MEQSCKTCNQIKPTDLFPKGGTYAFKCKACIAEQYRQKIPCGTCGKLISYSNMSKHMFVHNHNNPHAVDTVCDCGKVVKEYSLPSHKKTEKHIYEISILTTK
jgi:hypothetical protein